MQFQILIIDSLPMLSMAGALHQWPGRGNRARVEREPSTVLNGHFTRT
jgi:hypothetical protein